MYILQPLLFYKQHIAVAEGDRADYVINKISSNAWISLYHHVVFSESSP